MKYLILSDFHLGKGKFLKNGQLNLVEDFFEDDRFIEFLEYYSTGNNYLEKIHLVLNGDILNLIQIDIDGVFSHIIDEETNLKALKKIINGHSHFFRSLKNFIETPNKKITYIIGNHDQGMVFENAQNYLKKIVGVNLSIKNILDENGLHIEHGHRFEVINAWPKNNAFILGPNGKQILNLPWGSLFCIDVLPRLKKIRPHIDKVRPLSQYVRWTFFNDFYLFWKMTFMVLQYWWRTNNDFYTRQNKNYKTTLKLLKQITIYPIFGKKAFRILKKNPHLHTVVMGHTHVQEWRRFSNGKHYFNTGSWNITPTVDAGIHENNSSLAYCLININEIEKKINSASLNIWNGRWKPFTEEVNIV